MTEEDKYNLSADDVHKLKMDPHHDAWSMLSGELDRKQAIRASRPLRVAYFAIILSVVTTITYLSLSPVLVSIPPATREAQKAQQVNKDSLAPGFVAGKNDEVQLTDKADRETNSSSLTKRQSTANESAAKTLTKQKEKARDKAVEKNEPSMTEHKVNQNPAQEAIPKAVREELPEISKNNITPARDSNIVKQPSTPAPESKQDEAPVAISPPDISKEKETAGNEEIKNDSLKAFVQNTGNDSLAEKQNTNSRFSLAVFYAPNRTRNLLTKNTSSYYGDVSSYYDRETPEYAFSTGLTIHYHLSDHWSISTGGIYSTLSYSIDLPVIYAGYNESGQLTYRYPTSCGVISIPNPNPGVLKKGDSLVLNTRCSQVVNFISLPLTARYQINQNRFSFYSYAGLSVNFAIRERAKLSLNRTETTIINNIDGLKKMNYGYLFGAGIQYNFYNALGIFIEPSYRASINSLTKNISVNCYPYSLGLNAGLSLHF